MQTAAVAETLLELLIRFYRPRPEAEADAAAAAAARSRAVLAQGGDKATQSRLPFLL
jgi:hypothetical protein